MEPLKLNIAVPFRIDGKPEDHPGCLKQFDARDIRRYLDALENDIAAAALGTEDFQVLEIEFVNGSFTHLGTGNLKRIFECIGKHFNLHPKVKLRLNATPAALDFFTLTEAKQTGDCLINLELPTLDGSGLEAAGFISGTAAADNALTSCFQNGFHNLNCIISPRFCSSEQVFTSTVSGVSSRRPAFISFDEAPCRDWLAAAAALLEQAGYTQSGKNTVWYRNTAPFHRYYPEQIGCGPYAVSYIDGQAVRTTGDFDFYCENSDDFEALITH